MNQGCRTSERSKAWKLTKGSLVWVCTQDEEIGGWCLRVVVAKDTPVQADWNFSTPQHPSFPFILSKLWAYWLVHNQPEWVFLPPSCTNLFWNTPQTQLELCFTNQLSISYHGKWSHHSNSFLPFQTMLGSNLKEKLKWVHSEAFFVFWGFCFFQDTASLLPRLALNSWAQAILLLNFPSSKYVLLHPEFLLF